MKSDLLPTPHLLDTVEGAIRRLAECGVAVEAREDGGRGRYRIGDDDDLTAEQVIGRAWESAALAPWPSGQLSDENDVVDHAV